MFLNESNPAPIMEIKERTPRIIKSSNPFQDKRGRIDNYELPYPVNMANIITSKEGEIRANHYHPEQTQQCLVVLGKYLSVYLDLTKPGSALKSQIVGAGDLEVMPPMVAHAMIFLEDTTFLNLVGGNRDHDKYGKEHTIPYQIVSEDDAKKFRQLHKSS